MKLAQALGKGAGYDAALRAVTERMETLRRRGKLVDSMFLAHFYGSWVT
jgi:hypothetical protein